MLLAINAGYYNTKIGVTEKELITIPSRVQINVDASRSIEYNGFVYEVGAGHRSLDDKTESLCHNLMTKYSLLKYARSPKISLMVALPLSMYLNKGYREKYRESLIGEHIGVCDGKEVTVTVTDCTVFAEGAAAYLAHKDILDNQVVGLLDFGGNTINCLIYENGKLIKDSISQLDLGIIKLERQLIDTINQEMLWNVQDYELLDVIKSGECSGTVARVMNEFTNEIKQRLLEKKWNIGRLSLFATGGGVTLLKPFLEAEFDRLTISKNPLYDNVIGLLRAGNVLYGPK